MATSRERHPHAYNESITWHDPRQRKRTVPLEVISAGYSRTGTMTMKAALEILGYPTWHWVDAGSNPLDFDMWTEALMAKFDPAAARKDGINGPFGRSEFDQLLGHWSATTDQPAAIFTDDLINAYPEAKVILHERDVEKWYVSYDATVISSSENPFIPVAQMIDPEWMQRSTRMVDATVKYYFNVDQPRQFTWTNNPEYFRQYREHAKDTYLRHNAMVKRTTPEERLLIFKLEDGWEPLCNFLGKPIPNVPFPKVNETEVLREKAMVYISESYRRALIRMARKAAPVTVVVVAAALAWFSMG